MSRLIPDYKTQMTPAHWARLRELRRAVWPLTQERPGDRLLVELGLVRAVRLPLRDGSCGRALEVTEAGRRTFATCATVVKEVH